MAKNREPVKHVEPESSEEEDEDSESGDSSEEETDLVTRNPLPAFESDSEGSESETDDSEGSDSDQLPRAEAPKPATNMQQNSQKSSNASGSQKPILKKAEPATEIAVTPAKGAVTPAKRPTEGKQKDGKKQKKKPDPEPQIVHSAKKPIKSDSTALTDAASDSSKKRFQRLWSDDDEIAILQGMIDYEAKNKASPRSDFDAFLEFIKKNLHVDVIKSQLQDKIRRLKLRYDKNKSKDRTGFKNPHDQSVYDLSDKIWGNDIQNPSSPGGSKVNGSLVKRTPAKNLVVENDERGDGMSLAVRPSVANRGCHCGLTMEEKILSRGDDLFARGYNLEAAKEWKRLQKEDMELALKKVDVMRAQMKLVLDNWD